MAGDEIRRQALARDIARRLQLANHDELRALDRVLLALEIVREGVGDRRWQRRLPTGPGDRDRSFHLALWRPTRGVVETLCNGSWKLSDAAEQRTNPPLAERCRACWLRAVDGDWLAVQLIALANELEDEDRERAELREQARAEMLGGEQRPRGGLTAAARSRLDAVVDSYRPTCTGLTARWCPICGNCKCGGGDVELNDPGCPLHAPSSPHAESPARILTASSGAGGPNLLEPIDADQLEAGVRARAARERRSAIRVVVDDGEAPDERAGGG